MDLETRGESPLSNQLVTIVLEDIEEVRLVTCHLPEPRNRKPLPEVPQLPYRIPSNIRDLGYAGLNLLTKARTAETPEKSEQMQELGAQMVSHVIDRLPDVAPQHFTRRRTRRPKQ